MPRHITSCNTLFWIAIFCICLSHSLLLIPNYDDGNAYFFNLYNIVGLRNPFYNDLYGQYFHFMKPATVLYGLVASGADARGYRMLALLQGLEILACAALMYHCARRYASRDSARAGTFIFLCLYLSQWGVSPLRPETTVLLCCLAAFWLCERFKETGRMTFLAWASAVSFLIAIPMHTCGVIPCIYLLLFAICRQRQLSRQSLLCLGALCFTFALIGAAVLIYPGFSSFAESLALFSFDGYRFSGLWGELFRIKNFTFNPVNFPVLIFMAAVVSVALAGRYKQLALVSLRARLEVLLYFGAVVIGLGVLPSATWGVYTAYYYLPLVIGFAIAADALDRREGCRPLLSCALVLCGVAAAWCSGLTMPGLFFGLCAAGFACAALAALRAPASRITAILVVPLLLYRGVDMASTKVLFDRAQRHIEGTGAVVLGGAWFRFFGDNMVSINGSWCGAKTEIVSGPEGGAVINTSVAEERAAQIRNHRLVRIFGPAPRWSGKGEWQTPKTFGTTFYGLSNEFCNTTAFLRLQQDHLQFEIVKKIPLSDEFLDRYANPVVRGLQFLEYRLR